MVVVVMVFRVVREWVIVVVVVVVWLAFGTFPGCDVPSTGMVESVIEWTGTVGVLVSTRGK